MQAYENATTLEEAIQRTLTDGKVYEYPQAPPRAGEKKLYLFVKRLMDIVLSAVALLLLSPVFLIVAVAIKLDSKGLVFYSQWRVGKDGKPFMMHKFRSMCINADDMLDELRDQNERDGPVFKIKEDPRVTRVGDFIRKTCIDELPQLVNILNGEMSIVGPRPPLPNEVEQYTPRHHRRLTVKPGLTCYWQISNNKDMTFDEWVDKDIQYINERNLWIDLKIMLRTIPVVLKLTGDH